MILAGMVKATLEIINTLISAKDRPMECMIVVLNGAMLNHATNVRKNATQVRCRVPHWVLLKPNIVLTLRGDVGGRTGN